MPSARRSLGQRTASLSSQNASLALSPPSPSPLRECDRRGLAPLGRRKPLSLGEAKRTTSVRDRKRSCGRARVACRVVLDDVDHRERRDPRGVGQGLHRDQSRRRARRGRRRSRSRPTNWHPPALRCGPAARMPNAQPPPPAQAEMLTGEGETCASTTQTSWRPPGIRRRTSPRERARAAADVQHPPRSGDAQHDPQPAHVVELMVGHVNQIHVGGIHAGLAQQPTGRTPRIDLGAQLPNPGDRPRARLPVGHGDRLAHPRSRRGI